MKAIYALLPALAAAQISFQNVTFSGTGCEPDRWALVYSVDEQSFTANVFDLFAGVGGSSPARSECDTAITLRFPVGCTAAKFSFFHQGFGNVDQGLTGSLSDTFSISQGSISPAQPKPFNWSKNDFGDEGDVYFYTTNLTAKVNVQKGHELVTITAKAVMQSAQVAGILGDVSADNVNFSIQDQKAC